MTAPANPSPPVAAGSCTDCGAAIRLGKWRKTTLCRACAARANARRPEVIAKMSAASLRTWADPDVRARRVATMTQFNRSLAQRELRRAAGLANQNVVRFAPCLPAGHPSRVKAGATLTERRIGWCPPVWRGEYQRLQRDADFTAAEARAIIEQQIAADLAALKAGTLPASRTIAVREAARWVREHQQKDEGDEKQAV